MNSSDPTPSCRPTKVEVPKELPKVSMVHTSLKKLKHHLAGFDVCLKLKTELLNKKDFIEKETYDKLFRSYTTLKKRCISLKVDTQLNQEMFQRDNSVSNQSAPNFDQYFELNELKAQPQEKDTVIRKLKERIKSLSGNMNEDKKKVLVITTLKNELRKLKGKYLADNVVTKHTIVPEVLKIDEEPIATRLLNNRTAHSDYLRKHKHKTASSSNKPMLSSTGVKPSTSASGSQPSGNTKKDKIQQTPSSTQKNKVEAYPRTCNGCMLSDNHDLCVLDFINDVNARAKSKSVKKSLKRKV
ncbi:hypothetical protein Tco_1444505 [Tanacetum coccineum]